MSSIINKKNSTKRLLKWIEENRERKQKQVIINRIDVKYREIENLDFQYAFFSKVMEKFSNENLEKMLKAVNIIQKEDALYNRQ